MIGLEVDSYVKESRMRGQSKESYTNTVDWVVVDLVSSKIGSLQFDHIHLEPDGFPLDHNTNTKMITFKDNEWYYLLGDVF